MTGQTISHYRILEKLGEGGMGVVYKAEDTKLKRIVALKFLPPQHRERFLREAQAAASLNHPNICTIHEVDEEHGFLAMELVEGKSVKDKIAERPLKLDEALDIAMQTCLGLQEAHEKGVVHRDIKPANLMLTAQEQLKVMDFGLAQVGDDTRLTKTGTSLGTPAYMSPEQAKGEDTDRRTDLWSVGVLLYEMLSGRLPFAGATEAAVTYGIVHGEAEPVTALRSGLPKELDRIVAKALEKDSGHRYQNAADLLVDLRRLQRPAQAASPKKWWIPVAAVVAVAGAASFLWLSRAPKPASPGEYAQITSFADSVTSPALSSDGRMLAFIRGSSTFYGQGEIYVKMLPNGAPVQLTRDGKRKMSPVFSPDGSRVAYTVVTGQFQWDTWVAPVLGGEPQLWLPNASGLTWTGERQVLFSEIKRGIHMGVVSSSESRAGARDVYLPAHERAMAHRSHLSPDGKWTLIVEMDNGGWLPCRLAPFDGTSAGRATGPAGQCTYAGWSPDGKWMFFSSNSGSGFHLWRQKFPDGQPVQITSGATQEEGLSIAPDGRALLTSIGIQQSKLVVHDARGEREVSGEGSASLPILSIGIPRPFADGGQNLYYINSRQTAAGTVSGELWVARLDSGKAEPALTGFSIREFDISPDGKRVLFSATGEDRERGIWLAWLDRHAPPQRLPMRNADSPHFGADGEIFFRASEGDRNYLGRVKESGGSWEKVIPDPLLFLRTISPDSEWLVGNVAAIGGNAGTRPNIAIHRSGGKRVTICANCNVQWSGDGKSFFVGWPNEGMGRSSTYVVPLRAGSALPPLPADGILSEDYLWAVPGVRVVERVQIIPGPDASIYAYTQQTVQRNIFKIPLP